MTYAKYVSFVRKADSVSAAKQWQSRFFGGTNLFSRALRLTDTYATDGASLFNQPRDPPLGIFPLYKKDEREGEREKEDEEDDPYAVNSNLSGVCGH